MTGSNGENTLHVRDSARKIVVRDLQGDGSKGGFHHAGFTPDDNLFWAGSDGYLHFWDVKSGRPDPKRKVFEEVEFPERVWFSPDGNQAWCRGDYGNSVLWDLKQQQGRRPRHNVSSLVLTGAGRPAYLALGRAVHPCNQALDLGDLGDLELGPSFQMWNRDTIRTMALSPDGKTLVTADEKGYVVVWDTATQGWYQWKHPCRIHDLAFVPGDNRHLATANDNGTIYILRLARPAPE
jgi:WD40 repeat protein